jgi:hypothetical protein
MKKINSLLHNPDVQGAITIAFIVCAIVAAFLLTLDK